jgi:penicillin-binding protein 1A
MDRNENQHKPVKRVVRGSEYSVSQPKQEPAQTKKNKKKSSVAKRTGKTIALSIGKTILTLFLILLIICCIVGTALTVFVMKYVDSEGIDLNNISLYSTSVIYGKNANGEDEIMQQLHLNGRREIVSIDEIPQYVQDAFVYTEDERFMDHEGVDWKRTISSFLKMLFKQDTSQGGSTITQQLIKNINRDFNNRTIDVKIKEILGALQLERHNAKKSILEAYLNYINLGNGNYGVQAAAKYYFNKDVSELTYAEAASLAATTKSPEKINIIDNPERNKERRDYSLGKMLEFGSITQEEYEAAIAEDVQPVNRTGENAVVDEGENSIYNWYVDATINQVKQDLMEQYDLSSADAMEKINGGGLQIYTSADINTQNYLESYFKDDSNFYSRTIDDPPQGAMIIMDYNGYVQAVVGGRGEKTESLSFSRATNDVRSAGSCMKPITTYALGINSDLIHWSYMMVDGPKKTINGVDWPKNYEETWTNRPWTMVDALRVSKNTIPVEIMQRLGNQTCYDFLQNELHISTLGDSNDLAENLTLGMMDYGVKLDELCAAYIMFGNNGNYNSPKYYTKVVDLTGKVLLENTPENSYAIDSDSAYIMNKMLQQVVESGTGTAAQLNGIEVAGKTGTSDDNKEFSFVGLTPYNISAIRFCYDQTTENADKNVKNKVYKPQQVWHDIMSDLLAGKSGDFQLDSTGVVEKYYCKDTGQLATSSCPNKAKGYYKEDNLPAMCSLHG